MTEVTTPPAPPANATEARMRLDALTADKAWGDRFCNGDIAAKKEFSDLTSMIAGGGDDVVSAAMSGNIGEVPSSALKMMAETAGMLREVGASEPVIEQVLKGHKVTAQEYKLVEAEKARLMKSEAFVKDYMAGDPEARKRLLLCDIVISGGIREEAAA
jgi:hypothetical protein